MSGRVRVTIDRLTVEGGSVANPAAFRAEVERQVALRVGAAAAAGRLTGGNLELAQARAAGAGGDPAAAAGAIAAAIVGGGS